MDFFDRHKALIITVLLCSIFLLGLYNINIANTNRQVRETLIQINQPPEELKQEEKVQDPPPPPPSKTPQLRTHQAFNQNRENPTTDVDRRLEEIFDKNAADQQASEEDMNSPQQGDYQLSSETSEEQRRFSEGTNESDKMAAQAGNLENSSIAYSLLGRQAIRIPNPIYTCDRPGKIVVNIVVNETGEVIETSINKASSTSTNQCLIDRALEYAAGALFTELAGRTNQPGTITYYFQN